MTLAELARRLYAARRAGVKLDLGRMRRLLAVLGHPERGRAVAIIGGTNGKGSTVAFTAAVARAAGRRVGAFTSPHLSRLAERFAVDGVSIDDDAVLAAGRRVEAAVPGVGADEPTFFERVTAMSLVAFETAGVDLVLLEVGLGGRFDATNAVDADVRCVTGVALDHQDYLGDTLADIAREKAGIFAAGRPAIIGRAGLAEGVALLRGHAEACAAAPIVVIDDDAVGALADTPLGLAGSYQRANAACALAVIDALGVTADPAARRRGLAAARLPGRLEQLDHEVSADAAHNPHAAAALARELAAPVVLVIGVSADKDLAGIAEALAPRADAVVATRSRNSRALAPDRIAAAFRAVDGALDVTCVDSVADAIAAARGRGAPVLVCGSLFVVGEAREACGLARPDELELADPL